jgi:hypothetical protein
MFTDAISVICGRAQVFTSWSAAYWEKREREKERDRETGDVCE